MVNDLLIKYIIVATQFIDTKLWLYYINLYNICFKFKYF